MTSYLRVLVIYLLIRSTHRLLRFRHRRQGCDWSVCDHDIYNLMNSGENEELQTQDQHVSDMPGPINWGSVLDGFIGFEM